MFVFCYIALLVTMFLLGYMQKDANKRAKIEQEVARQLQRRERQNVRPTINLWGSQDEGR